MNGHPTVPITERDKPSSCISSVLRGSWVCFPTALSTEHLGRRWSLYPEFRPGRFEFGFEFSKLGRGQVIGKLQVYLGKRIH